MNRLHIALPLILLLAAATGEAQTFQDFLLRVTSAPEPQRAAIVDSFMTATPRFPLIERDTLCHFLYRGTATSVTTPGDANGWNAAAFPLSRLSTTDLWYRTVVFEADARLDYKFVLNGGTWILDPRNPFQVSGGFGPNSELRMPQFVQPWEIVFNPATPRGTVRDSLVTSAILGNSRTIRIYTPPGYAAGTDSFPVMLFHDGPEYVTLGSAATVMDNLIAAQRIQPIIGVFVPPVNRTAEYAGAQMTAFTNFIVTELMPGIDARFRTRRDPAFRGVIGASNGGNISLWIGYTHPDKFGFIGAQSSNIVSSISTGFQNSPLLPLRLYMDLGTYDIPQLIPLVRSFIPILQSKGYPHAYTEYNDGHSWGNWRAHLDDALELAFPGPALSAPMDPVPRSIALLEAWPNPFNPEVTIRFGLPEGGDVDLTVTDILGRRVAELTQGRLTAGEHTVRFRGDNLSSGIYYAVLRTRSGVRSLPLLLVR